MNRSMQDDFKRDGFISQLMTRLARLEAFEREFRLKQFGGELWLPFGAYVTLPMPVAANPSAPYAASIPRDINFVKWTQALVPTAPNDGGNYWTISLYDSSVTVPFASFDTSALAAGVWSTVDVTVFGTNPAVKATHISILVVCAKTGAPGALYIPGPIVQVS